MIKALSKVIEKASYAGAKAVHLEGFIGLSDMRRAAESVEDESDFIEQLLAGEIYITVSEEAYHSEGGAVAPGTLVIRKTHSEVTAKIDGKVLCVYEISGEESLSSRLTKLATVTNESESLSGEQKQELELLGYQSAMEFYVATAPFPEDSAAHSYFKKGYDKALKEIENGL